MQDANRGLWDTNLQRTVRSVVREITINLRFPRMAVSVIRVIWPWMWVGFLTCYGLSLEHKKRYSISTSNRVFFFILCIDLLLSPASQRPGILNPWIWLANLAHFSGSPKFPIRTPSYWPLLNFAPKIVNLLSVLHFHWWLINILLKGKETHF